MTISEGADVSDIIAKPSPSDCTIVEKDLVKAEMELV
jgi:hypothetical protein